MNVAMRSDKKKVDLIESFKQFGLEKQLAGMKEDWQPLAFEVKDYKNSGTSLIGGLDDIIALLDEHIVKTQTMRGSPFVKGILKECLEWEEQLKYGQSMLDEWVKTQRTWYGTSGAASYLGISNQNSFFFAPPLCSLPLFFFRFFRSIGLSLPPFASRASCGARAPVPADPTLA